jgi:hypothetical protein
VVCRPRRNVNAEAQRGSGVHHEGHEEGEKRGKREKREKRSTLNV